MTTKWPAAKKVKDSGEVAEIVLDWFERENKPATAQSLTDALGSRVAKSVVQKTLEELVGQGKLTVKVIKKVRLFFPDYTTPRAEKEEASTEEATSVRRDPDSLVGEADPQEAVAREALCQQLLALSTDARQAEATLQLLMQSSTTAERDTQLGSVRAAIAVLEESIAERAACRPSAEDDKSNGDADEDGGGSGMHVQELTARYLACRRLWGERKGYAQRLLDAVFGDAYTEREIEELLGLVTDQAAGVSFRETAVTLPPFLR